MDYKKAVEEIKGKWQSEEVEPISGRVYVTAPATVLHGIEPMQNMDYKGPCRELAQTMLKNEITNLRAKANQLEALLKVIGEGQSDAEEALWQILCSSKWRNS